MAQLSEEEKEIIRKAKEIKRKVELEKEEERIRLKKELEKKREQDIRRDIEEDVDQLPEDYGEPVKRKVVKKQQRSNQLDASERARSHRSSTTSSVENSRKQRPPQRSNGKRTEQKEPVVVKKKRKKHKILRKIIWLLIILGIAFGALFFFIKSLVSKTNYEALNKSYTTPAGIMKERYVKNILLIGSDGRGNVNSSRSDAMILVSINSKSKKIIMTSILRDSYVTIPGHGQTRINHAYQIGGAPLLIQTIEENFKISIDDYVKVDFFSFIDIIDCVGGVKINVTNEEVQYINLYVNEINTLTNAPQGDGFLTEGGNLLLTGKQALGYSRIRYIGSDFQRTERQRVVLTALLNQIKGSGLSQIGKIIDVVIPDITTSITDTEMTWLILKSMLYFGYDMEQNRIPMDNTWSNIVVNNQEMLQIDFSTNIEGLRKTIYE